MSHCTHMKEKYASANDIRMSTFPMGTKLDGSLKGSGFHDLDKWHVHMTSDVQLGWPIAPIPTCSMGTKYEGGLKESGFYDLAKWPVHLTSDN